MFDMAIRRLRRVAEELPTAKTDPALVEFLVRDVRSVLHELDVVVELAS